MTTTNHEPTTTADDEVDERGADLLTDVATAISRYVILPTDDALAAVTLWVAATHAAPAWATAPRLVIRAPEKRCGKSRLLDLVEALSYRPLMTTNASPSAVYRSIGLDPSEPPTLLIDEADAIFGPRAGDNEDLRGLLNAGHQRGRPTLRYDAASGTVDKIATFALAALAGIGRMPDTIEDRAVIIRMRRRAPGETVRPYRLRRDRPGLDTLRADLHDWVRDHLDHLTDAVPVMPLEDRAADTWEPLIAIADTAGGHWPHTARAAALAMVTDAATEDDQSEPTRLLADLRDIFTRTGATALPTADILAELLADPESPWREHGRDGLTGVALARILRGHGITSRTIRFPTGQAKGYEAATFADAWARYLPTDDTNENGGQLATENTPEDPTRTSRTTRPTAGQPRDGSQNPPVPHPSQPSQLHLITHQTAAS